MARIVTLILFLIACALTAEAEEQCRRVQLTGTVKTIPVPKPGFRGTSNGPEGKFRIELLFAENGGEPISQKNFVELDKIKSYSFGGAKECSVTLPESSHTPRTFAVSATLTPDNVVSQYGSDPREYVSDQLDLKVNQLPPTLPVKFTIQCEGGRPGELSDFGVTYNQLLMPFLTRSYIIDIKLNKIGDKSSPYTIDIPGGFQATVEWDQLETMVPCRNFQ